MAGGYVGIDRKRPVAGRDATGREELRRVAETEGVRELWDGEPLR